MSAISNESALDHELYLHPDVARDLLENEALVAFFDALTNVDPQGHGTGFILSDGATPAESHLKELNGSYSAAQARHFPLVDSMYDARGLADELEKLVKVDGITEIVNIADPVMAAVGRSALYWDGGVCDALEQMGIPNNRPLPERFGFKTGSKRDNVGTGTLSVVTASHYLSGGYTVRLHDDGKIHVFRGGLIVGSTNPAEIRGSFDAYESAAPERNAYRRAHAERPALTNLVQFPGTPTPTPPRPAAVREERAYLRLLA